MRTGPMNNQKNKKNKIIKKELYDFNKDAPCTS